MSEVMHECEEHRRIIQVFRNYLQTTEAASVTERFSVVMQKMEDVIDVAEMVEGWHISFFDRLIYAVRYVVAGGYDPNVRFLYKQINDLRRCWYNL